MSAAPLSPAARRELLQELLRPDAPAAPAAPAAITLNIPGGASITVVFSPPTPPVGKP